MNLACVSVGPFEVNCFVASNREGEALVIDPGGDADRIRAALDNAGLRAVAVALTHGHADHIGALDEFAADPAVSVYMHPADAEWAFSPINRLPPFYETPVARPANLRAVHGGDRIEAAGLALDVIGAPGHTPGGICLYCPDAGILFVGDTLFNGSAGRTDLPGGDGAVLAQSLREIARLPQKTRVCCGHGPATSLAAELGGNPYLRAALAGRPVG